MVMVPERSTSRIASAAPIPPAEFPIIRYFTLPVSTMLTPPDLLPVFFIIHHAVTAGGAAWLKFCRTLAVLILDRNLHHVLPGDGYLPAVFPDEDVHQPQ